MLLHYVITIMSTYPGSLEKRPLDVYDMMMMIQ